MEGSKNRLLNEYLLVYMFCMAVIIGPAIACLFQYDLTHYPDCKTYLGLAHFEFDQNPVRRYRVIIPFAAGALNYLFGGIFGRLSPAYFYGDYSLAFSFFLVNTFLTSWFGLLIYRYCKAFGVDKTSAIIGTLAMLTCRYTIATAALPLVDSLFCVVTMLTLLGIKLKDTRMLLWAIFLGPFAKESFIFIAPLIFFFSHIDKKRLVLYFLLSGVLVFGYRYLYDVYTLKIYTLHPVAGGLESDMNHVYNVVGNLRKLFSGGTMFKIMMNIGLWGLVPLLVLFAKKGSGKTLLGTLDKYLVFYLLAVIVQMLLSGSMERMFYLAMPFLCVVVALSVSELRKIYHPA
jgi:hypothetical protein